MPVSRLKGCEEPTDGHISYIYILIYTDIYIYLYICPSPGKGRGVRTTGASVARGCGGASLGMSGSRRGPRPAARAH